MLLSCNGVVDVRNEVVTKSVQSRAIGLWPQALKLHSIGVGFRSILPTLKEVISYRGRSSKMTVDTKIPISNYMKPTPAPAPAPAPALASIRV
jgi:hypothetical protein